VSDFGGLDEDRPSKIGFQKVFGGCEARGILFGVPKPRHAEPHVCSCLLDVDVAVHGDPATMQTACKAQ